jgi:hypothetical protein
MDFQRKVYHFAPCSSDGRKEALDNHDQGTLNQTVLILVKGRAWICFRLLYHKIDPARTIIVQYL